MFLLITCRCMYGAKWAVEALSLCLRAPLPPCLLMYCDSSHTIAHWEWTCQNVYNHGAEHLNSYVMCYLTRLLNAWHICRIKLFTARFKFDYCNYFQGTLLCIKCIFLSCLRGTPDPIHIKLPPVHPATMGRPSPSPRLPPTLFSPVQREATRTETAHQRLPPLSWVRLGIGVCQVLWTASLQLYSL